MEKEPATEPSRPIRRSDLLALFVVVAAASIAYAGLSFLRFSEFYSENWDLGVNMQAAWSTAHGGLAYASAISESAQASSFFFVHPTYLFFPVSVVYGLAPYALTLFAIQAAALASSAIPLYLVGRHARLSHRVALVGVGIYLVSLPILSGFLFDYHWESFIPAAFLWTFYLWQRGHYWWAIVPATLGFLTIEVFPALILGIAAYFAWPFFRALFAPPRKSVAQVWQAVKGPARPIIGLVAVAVAGFVIPVMVQWYLLPVITGTHPVFPAPGPNTLVGIPYWGVSASTVGFRLLYWLVIIASFGFLPVLFRQRLLILSVPWAVYTVVMTPNPAFTTIGFHYSLIAVAPLAVGFVEGLGIVAQSPLDAPRAGFPVWGWPVLLLPLLVVGLVSPLALVRPSTSDLWLGLAIGSWVTASFLILRFAAHSRGPTGPDRPRARLSPKSRRMVFRATVVGAVIVLAVSNVAVSPLNPANALGPGAGSYSFTYNPSPSFSYMPQVVSHIWKGASILASDNLFPFVANNPHAYSTLWYPSTPTYLPFNSSNLPAFVLLSSTQWFVPAFLSPVLFNESVYGLVVELYAAAYPGSIFLFQLGYAGSSSVVQVTPFPRTAVYCGNELAIGPSGTVVPVSGTRCGNVVESRPASNLSGNNDTIWYGPYVDLLPGNYTVTISLRGQAIPPGPSDSAILVMNANAAGLPYWYNVVVYAYQLSPTQWTNFTYHFTLNSPRPLAEWRGYVAGATVDGQFVPGFSELNYIEVDYSPS